MVFNGGQSINNIKLTNSMISGLDFVYNRNTTLNEKFKINADYNLSELEGYPKLSMITLGVGGTSITDNNRLNLKDTEHSALDCALFEHIPFYMRKTESTELYPKSTNYRLCDIIEYNGENYEVCYGYKVTDLLHSNDVVVFNSIEDTYVNMGKVDYNTNDYLSPVPKSDIELGNTPSRYITDLLKIYVFFTNDELIELENVLSILYGDTSKPITEIGVVTGHELEIDGVEVNVGSFISYFLSSNISIPDSLDAGFLDFNLEIGGMETIRV